MGTPTPPTPPSPEKIKIAADCWRRGNEAVPKENWDYAIQMYGTSAKLVPDNVMYRQSLRGTEYKKYDNNGVGAKLANMRLMGVKTKLKKCKLSKDWAAVVEACEEGLQVNPWDAQLGADLGDALNTLGYADVAIFAYEESLKVDPTNVAVNKSLAALLEDRGEYPRAIECWNRILKVDPNSGEARSKKTALDARAVMDRGGYEGAESTRNVMAPHEIAKRLGKDKNADGPGVSVEADLQRAIRKEPANKDNYLKLADYYKREAQPEKAEEQLLIALEVSGNDIAVREILEDVQIALMIKTLNITKEQARSEPGDASIKQRAGELANELLKRELEVLAARVERYPNDMKLKFELALRYMRVKKWQLAIPLLQQSRGDPRLKGDSLFNLGKCFYYDGKPQLAIRQFEAAMAEIKYEEKPDLFKELNYAAGRLYEELKNSTAAEEAYQRVLEVDYGFRDTVDRLNKLQGGTAAPAAEEE
jgi:tetratricopeptide (TPR) repeat protein